MVTSLLFFFFSSQSTEYKGILNEQVDGKTKKEGARLGQGKSLGDSAKVKENWSRG